MPKLTCLLLLIAALGFPAAAYAEITPCDWRQPVQQWDGTQTDLNQCAADKFKNADNMMNKLYNEKLAALSQAATKKRFREAQRAWIAFRDKACLYETGPQAESGSIWPMQNFLCLAGLTGQRVENLKLYAACTEDGCPN